jgi:tripartite-type tricarboxylate transporter receptor subunit TctC
MGKGVISVIGVILLFAVFCSTASLRAQTYPDQPLQLIMTLAPGDGLDITGRVIAEQLGKILKTPVVPTNKLGAGGAAGTDYVVKGKKDGYNILYTNSSLIYNYALNPENTPYNPFQDLEPLCSTGSVPLLIAVQPESPWKSFRELVDYMKINPGKIRGGTSGAGSIGNFCFELIRGETGAGIDMIPFKAPGPAFTAFLGGHLEVGIPALSIVSPQLAAGKVRALLTSKKIPQYPNIPTLTELGYKRDMPSVWNAAFVPTGVDSPVKKVLASAFERAISTSDVVNTMQKSGYVQDYRLGEEFKKAMLNEYLMVKEFFKTMSRTAK